MTLITPPTFGRLENLLPRPIVGRVAGRPILGRVWTALRWQGFFGVVRSAGRGGHVFGLLLRL